MHTILEGARQLYPRETVVILRGKIIQDTVQVSELLVPPLANYGQGFTSLPFHMLPLDFSLIGTVHSHPSGILTPSPTDLNRSIGTIIMIVGFPFADESNVAVYSREGRKLPLKVVPTSPSSTLSSE